jgi:hypothetical protein
VTGGTTGFYCATCGQYHEGLPMSIGFRLPESITGPPEAREHGIEMTDDWCALETEDDQSYFVRGCLEIPVIDGSEPFVWSVWASLSEDNFYRTMDLWTDMARTDEPPYFGWLCTSIPGYPETLLLKTMVQTRAVGLRPTITLEPTDHPLAVEQREGITMARAHEFAAMALHSK